MSDMREFEAILEQVKQERQTADALGLSPPQVLPPPSQPGDDTPVVAP